MTRRIRREELRSRRAFLQLCCFLVNTAARCNTASQLQTSLNWLKLRNSHKAAIKPKSGSPAVATIKQWLLVKLTSSWSEEWRDGRNKGKARQTLTPPAGSFTRRYHFRFFPSVGDFYPTSAARVTPSAGDFKRPPIRSVCCACRWKLKRFSGTSGGKSKITMVGVITVTLGQNKR